MIFVGVPDITFFKRIRKIDQKDNNNKQEWDFAYLTVFLWDKLW